MATRADQDANLNALINAGIREGGGVQFDIVPIQNSANGITSGGMYSTLKDSNIGFVDNEPTAGSDNLAKSGGIRQYLDNINIKLNGNINIDVDNLIPFKGTGTMINFDGLKWSNSMGSSVCSLIPIDTAKYLFYKSQNLTYVAVFAFLTDDYFAVNETPHYCVGYENVYYQTTLINGLYKIPSDCKYVYTLIKNSSGILQVPQELSFSEYIQPYSLDESINYLEDRNLNKDDRINIIPPQYIINNKYLPTREHSVVTQSNKVLSALIPTNGVITEITVVAGDETYVPVFAFLKTNKFNVGEEPDWCDACESTYYDMSTTKKWSVPIDCNYIYATILDGNGFIHPIKEITFNRRRNFSEFYKITPNNIFDFGTSIGDFWITGDGKWTKGQNHNCVLIPVSEGDIIKIDTGDTVGRLAFLTSAQRVTNTNAPFCSGYQLIKLPIGAKMTYTVPSDCKYIYTIATQAGTNYFKEISVNEGVVIDNSIDYIAPFSVDGVKNTFKTPLFECHRGIQTFGPENSIPSMMAAAVRGVWAIETDFWKTLDGHVVCHHDNTINRGMVRLDGQVIPSNTAISSLTLNQLRTEYKLKDINDGSVNNKIYNYNSMSDYELRIPTMEEYFDICSSYGIVPFIELKEDNGIVDLMMDSMKRHSLNGKCIISTFDFNILSSFRQKGGIDKIHHIGSNVNYIAPLVQLGNASIAFSEITNMDADLTNQYIYDGHNPTNLKELIEMLHSYGLWCCFYLVDTKADAQKAIKYGVDFMPTDNLWTRSQII